MVFDPSKFKAPKAKRLPVILLLDVSGSMYGEKIKSLCESVSNMLKVFEEAQQRERLIDVAIITFGEEVLLHTSYTSVSALIQKSPFSFAVGGMTPMGTALAMAKEMIEDKSVTPSDIYRPAVVLVSDGAPNDKWEEPLSAFINNGRSSKCQRFSVAIGNDADRSVLSKFCSEESNLFNAENAEDILDAFVQISMSVSARAASANPNMLSAPSVKKQIAPVITEDDDDDEDSYM